MIYVNFIHTAKYREARVPKDEGHKILQDKREEYGRNEVEK
jgi:hypothetical protein